MGSGLRPGLSVQRLRLAQHPDCQATVAEGREIGVELAREAQGWVFETGRSFMRGLAIGPVVGSEVALLMVPFVRDGRVVLAAVARIDPVRLSRLLEGQGLEGGDFATLMDDSN